MQKEKDLGFSIATNKKVKVMRQTVCTGN